MTHEEYVKAADYWKNKKQDKIICVTPKKIEVLCSDFKKDGYSSRQTLDLK